MDLVRSFRPVGGGLIRTLLPKDLFHIVPFQDTERKIFLNHLYSDFLKNPGLMSYKNDVVYVPDI